ncbi:MAG: murein L,D-transpeptidase [Acidimicrobiales bacterium]|nr:murein L,D-transpeptidase [Acidimicrobiales bacterium]
MAPTLVPPPPSSAPSDPGTAPLPPSPEPVLRLGDSGPAVRELQLSLNGLGYWLGDADGSFDEPTHQAVYAFQKSQGLTVDGLAGPEVRAALASPGPVTTRFAEPDGVEIDLGRQLLIFVRGGSPFLVLNTSTGTDEPYEHPTQGRQLADTPVGRFTVSWDVDGVSEGELGPLYRPKFFHRDGIAVHGYDRVPPVPVSHGCARVSPEAMDLIWQLDLMPIGGVVLVHGSPPVG